MTREPVVPVPDDLAWVTDPIPISALEHYEYCKRQCALMLVDGVWFENRHTVAGQRFHRRVDSGEQSTIRGTTVTRGVQLWSDRWKLHGRADAVEIDDDTVIPVEYKAGTRHGQAAKIQVCAQALCLEEMLQLEISTAGIWYGRHRRRETVELDASLRAATIESIVAVHKLRVAERLPPPVNDHRCAECQLIGHCLPELHTRTGQAREYLSSVVFDDADGRP